MSSRDRNVLDRRGLLKSGAAAAAALSLEALFGTSSSSAAIIAELEWSAAEVVAKIKSRAITAEAYCKLAVKAYEQHKQINAITWFDESRVLEAAREIDKAIASGRDPGILAGLPIVVKDNIDTNGFPTTAGTPGLKDYRPKGNSPVVQALLKQGAILFGKTNMHELAQGGTTNNPTWGPTRNPYDTKRIPGGSSGGTAAAIAARIVPAGLGTDTLGSVRIPAAFCGLAALRPSIGPNREYSLDGVVPLRLSMDTIGPVARTVSDVALLHSAITGKPIAAPTSIRGVRLGIPEQFYWQDIDPEVERVCRESLSKLKDAGAVLVDVDVSSILDANKIHWVFTDLRGDLSVWVKEHYPSLSYDALVENIKTEPVRMNWKADPPPAAAREAALASRERLIVAYQKLFEANSISAIVYPTEMTTALLIRTAGDSPKDTVEIKGKSFTEAITTIRNTAATGVFNAPGITIPVGLSRDGLPVGIDFDGLMGGDVALLSLARSAENIFGKMSAPSLG